MAAVVAISFLLSATALSGEPEQAGPLVLHISAAGWGEGGKTYSLGKPISVRVEVKNSGAKPLTLMLRDHDPYMGTRPYPDSMLLRVSDARGLFSPPAVAKTDGGTQALSGRSWSWKSRGITSRSRQASM